MEDIKNTMSITGEGTGEERGRGWFGNTNKKSASRPSDPERGVQHGGRPT